MSEGLRAQELSVTFRLPGQDIRAVDGVTAHFPGGQITGLIGESGCGKSVLGLAALGLLPPYAKVEGELSFEGIPLKGSRRDLGRRIGLIPQNPSESLNPARTVAAHLKEALLPLGLSRAGSRERAAELLCRFGFQEPEAVLRAYPHQLSGGMQQRVLCAIGAACSPAWILADEPTKGLDRDLREQVQETLLSLKEQGVESMLVITHDIPLAQAVCQGLAVMYAGQILEMGPSILKNPLHPYTAAFLNALPQNGFRPIPGAAPRAGERLPGCPFAPRCSDAGPTCKDRRPSAYEPEEGHIVRCFRYA
ncbi:MAG: ABC transporter ATP-binding protein [Oscillibacter sp.]|nr:ABC transporter ATP-binding protein [Oscillibacter sp.]